MRIALNEGITVSSNYKIAIIGGCELSAKHKIAKNDVLTMIAKGEKWTPDRSSIPSYTWICIDLEDIDTVN
jgi:hypothetical protein